jgi:hypothetical protein
MLTGYEQVRSIVAAITGDWASARRVELTLPETGVCTLSQTVDDAAGCCTPTTTAIEALDAVSPISGCGSPQPELVGVGAVRTANGGCS